MSQLCNTVSFIALIMLSTVVGYNFSFLQLSAQIKFTHFIFPNTYTGENSFGG